MRKKCAENVAMETNHSYRVVSQQHGVTHFEKYATRNNCSFWEICRYNRVAHLGKSATHDEKSKMHGLLIMEN
jgi:hypothetical protein